MNILDFLFKKRRDNKFLKIVFDTAKKGAYQFNFPITNAGRLELLMYDIWLGMRILENKDIWVDYDLMLNQREKYLRKAIHEFGFSIEEKYENIYLFREEGWEHDTLGLAYSDYPRTKQFIPAYLYLCIVACPLKVYTEEKTEKEIDKIPLIKMSNFLSPFCEHYSWVVRTIINKIKNA